MAEEVLSKRRILHIPASYLNETVPCYLPLPPTPLQLLFPTIASSDEKHFGPTMLELIGDISFLHQVG